MGWLNWIFVYITIGVIISVLTWLFYTSKWCKRKISEDTILVYLPICTILWPMCVVGAIYESYKYLKNKWDF